DACRDDGQIDVVAWAEVVGGVGDAVVRTQRSPELDPGDVKRLTRSAAGKTRDNQNRQEDVAGGHRHLKLYRGFRHAGRQTKESPINGPTFVPPRRPRSAP